MSRFSFRPRLLLSVLLALLLPGCAQAGPRNIIVMIADGAGYNVAQAASLFRSGELSRLPQQQLSVQFAVSTFPAGGSYDPAKAWTDFAYLKSGFTDSAAVATALVTGVKTKNGWLGVDPQGQPLKTILERAEELGKATGVVTDDVLCGATPAGYLVHVAGRGQYERIAADMFGSATDVIMGRGHPPVTPAGQEPKASDYQFVGGVANWNQLVAGTLGADAKPGPWKLVPDAAAFAALSAGQIPPRPAVVSAENLPLRDMAAVALSALSRDPDGFFVMIEEAETDHAGHANNSAGAVEAELSFSDAVQTVLDWVGAHSNWTDTLLVVLSDHETGLLTGPDSDPEFKPLVNNGVGKLPGMQWHTGNHCNTLIPLFAKGDVAAAFAAYADETDPVRGKYLDNTEVAKVLFEAFR